jgi:hypothetical protein
MADGTAPQVGVPGSGEQAAPNEAHSGEQSIEPGSHETDSEEGLEPEALPQLAGSADAIEPEGARAEDAGWAVRPESMDDTGGPEGAESDGRGGGQAGSSSGARAGAAAGGGDGTGEGEGAAGPPGDTAGTPSSIEDSRDLAAVDDEQEETPPGEHDPEDGSLTGQTDAPPGGDPGLAKKQAARHHSGSDDLVGQVPASPGSAGSDRPDSEAQPPAARPIDPSELASSVEELQPMGSEAWHRQVRGAWKLIAVHDPDRDFLPRGASERLIGIDPDARVLRAVLRWDGDVSVSMAAEYEVGFRPKWVEIQPVPHAPSKFPTDPGPLLGGGQFEPAISPPPCELMWARRGDRLTIGGAEYEAADPDVMVDLLSQPEPGDGDVGGSLATWKGEEAEEGGPAATVDFFGVQAEGRYFCYIVDISGSMKGNGGMLRLRMELERSLGSLPSGTRFTVLPFNSTLRDFQSHWTSASPAKARDIGRRFSRIGARGGTNPTTAFSWALRELTPQPDAIFFMTDGQMMGDRRQLLEHLASLNASNPRTRVYTIGLGDGADIQFLEQMAEAHGGTCRAVR